MSHVGPKKEEGKLADMEQEDVVNSAQHGAGSVPAGDSSANLPEGHNGSSGERLNDVNDEIRDQADALRNAGGNGGQDRSASPPGGGGDDSCCQNDWNVEARERAIMKALDLIEESNEILHLADGHPCVHLVGQSKEEARRLLNNVKACRMEFRELRIPDDDEVLITLINARRDLLRVLTESDNFEYANGTRAAAAAPAQSSPPPPSQPAREPETGLRYMLAMRQMDCEIGRQGSPRLIDVAPGADVKPDILKDLLKVDAPDVRKSVDRARDALKTLTAVATIADAEKLLDAQDACEQAISWIAMVEERCKGEQLHLDVKQEPREVDFIPFRPGNGGSIYEFFHKFENWVRGQMSQDHKANVLYNHHLYFSVTDGNKELEDAKGNYPAMKSLLMEK
jgi:hypothetical protein